MQNGRGSRTAERVAERRAAHQLLDAPRVFEDPLALRILDPHVASQLAANPLEFESSLIAPYMRAALAVRSRFAEDSLRDAVLSRGIRQYVVLGAGFDTFAYRNPFADLRVFEVDHPSTQAVKRERLAAADIAVPQNLTFVPIDFASSRLADVLKLDGPAFFSWLGVVPYLELDAIRETFRFVASLARGSELVFDYGSPRESLSFLARRVFDRLAERVAAAGEPFKSFFEPGELRRILREDGFSIVEDLTPDDLNRRYFDGRRDGLRIGEMAHLARAVV
ncbi:MAG TPA: class I SAM-dependent methyltransferase [Thermoanaerobaculia bacterium]|nr:class I SAM-dependent methyltransferase [Thermoanaerobaculia bacterium]